MKTKLLFTIVSVFMSFQMILALPLGNDQNQEMRSENLFANGKVLTLKVQSPALANNALGDSEFRKISVYLPPGYDENGVTSYPVIYMLSDVNETNENWFHISENQALTEVIDKSIKSGKIKPMILVFPDGKNKFGGSWYTNSTVSGNWEDFVVNDLINYIDQNFRTLPFAMSRGIAGKGMGGYGALKLATKNPGVFSAVYSLNALVDFETVINHPYIWDSSFKTAALATKFPTKDEFANKLLGMAVAFAPEQSSKLLYGTLPKTENGDITEAVYQKWMKNDPLAMIEENLENLRKLKAITVDCSTADSKIMLNSKYSEVLDSKNIKHNFTYFEGNGTDIILNRFTEVLLPVFSNNLACSLLEFCGDSCYDFTDTLKASLKTDGSIFIVPSPTANNLKSIQENQVIKLDVIANKEYEIPLTDFRKGIYSIYGVSSTGFIDKPHTFGINSGQPQITILVICAETGKIMDSCSLKINDMDCIINGKGEYCFKGEGVKTICTRKKDYGPIQKSVTIYTDTLINLPLVHDSYLQVVDKNYGSPIFEAMVTQNNTAKLTGLNGFTTVQNLSDGILKCSVFKEGYFAENVTTPLKPGSTTVIALTPKKAEVMFILVGNQGHLKDGTIKLGAVTIKPDEFGRAVFKDLDTRAEYSYDINNTSYNTIHGSVFLESNTVLPIYLEPKKSDANQLKYNQFITEATDQLAGEIMIYPNPATDAITVQTNGNSVFVVELTTINGSVIYTSKIEETLHQINLSNLTSGVYFVTLKSDKFYHTRKIMKL